MIQQSIATTVITVIDSEVREFSRIVVDRHEMFVFEASDASDQNVVMRQIGSDVFAILSNRPAPRTDVKCRTINKRVSIP